MSNKHLILKKESFKDYYLNDESQSLSYIPNFNRINIIVGANNSGKSRFLRFLMNQQKNEFVVANFYSQYNELVEQYRKDRGDDNLLFLNLNQDLKNIHIHNTNLLRGERTAYAGTFEAKLGNIREKLILDIALPKTYYIPTLRTAHSLYQSDIDGIRKRISKNGSPHKYKKINRDIYLETIEMYYELEEAIEVFTGMHLYKEILNSRNSEKKIRNRFEEFEKFLSCNFFNGKSIDVVAKFNKDENDQGKSDSELILIHVEGEKETRTLYELGDGIQAIIILMYKIFMADKNSYIFIDEPELHLHPGMQRLFLEQICVNEVLQEKNLTYIINTHSNHLLDLTIEKDGVSIYSFSPIQDDSGENRFLMKNVNFGNNTLLKHLGVNNSSVFMANCSIWVEGISDRNYIKAFLKSYLSFLSVNIPKKYKSIKEDIDYAFFEYAGSNVEHYFFGEVDYDDSELIIDEINSLSLSNRIFLLADSDQAESESAKYKRLKKIEESKGNNFHPKIVWDIREIENLLTNDIWNNILIHFCHKKIVSKDTEIIKQKINEALSEVNYDNYSKKYIGEFLNQVNIRLGEEGKINILNQSIYEKKSEDSFGTFIQKRELSELVLKANFPWEVFSKNPRIAELTEEVYKFIINEQ